MDELLNTFTEVRECDYKGEHYSVRDNGAVMRHPKPGKKPRPSDNEWTFGLRDEKTAYMKFGTHRIHIIVANAFLGEHDSKVYVVDHIDTNRCNNRVSNLRWFTRLENALNNPITRKRIEWLCGGDIQKFIDDPSCLRTDNPKTQDLSWMRIVSAEEARNAMENLSAWAKKPVRKDEGSYAMSGGGVEKDSEWMYKKRQFFPVGSEVNTPIAESQVAQNNSGIDFLIEPKTDGATIEDYFNRLKPGVEFCQSMYGVSKVIEAKISMDKTSIGVAVTFPSEIKHFAAYKIFAENGKFVYEFLYTCFEENGALQRMTEAAGETWTGPDSVDNYC